MLTTRERIYAFNRLKSVRGGAADEQGYLLAGLLDIEHKQSSGETQVTDFAAQVLNCFRAVNSRSEISRVCLSFHMPFSRRLSVLSTMNQEKTELPELRPGYACYVSPLSSLFRLLSSEEKEAAVRTYSDMHSVLDGFKAAGQPLQRTIGKLAAAGYRSGLTLGINLGDFGSGLLFLNSKKVGAFEDWVATHYQVLCQLQLIAKSMLLRLNPAPLVLDPQLKAILSQQQLTNLFIADPLGHMLSLVLEQRFGLSISIRMIDKTATPVFFPAQTALALACRLIETIPWFTSVRSIEVTAELMESTRKLALTFDFGGSQELCANEHRLSLASLLGTVGFEIKYSRRGFTLSAACEDAGEIGALCDYSTYHWAI